MIIPEGVNQIEFYKAAKAKGIKIGSRYKGVHVTTRNDNDICWGTKKLSAECKRIGHSPLPRLGNEMRLQNINLFDC